MLDQGIVSEIHQQANAQASRFKIIVKLRAMFIRQFAYRLAFHDHLIETDKVRLIGLGEHPPFVFQL